MQRPACLCYAGVERHQGILKAVESVYQWGLIGVAAAALVAWAWGVGTLVRLADTPIMTTIN
jgi:hypothetical protein